jgi:hypothetical protein
MKLLLLPALLATGCVTNDLDLTIDRFVPALVENSCSVSPTQMDSLTNGVLDVGLAPLYGGGYTVFPVVTNNLNPTSTSSPSKVELHAITFTGANVELQPDAIAAPFIPPNQRKFFVGVSGGRLEPNGQLASGIRVIPPSLAVALAGGAGGRVTAQVSPVGDYSGDKIIGAAVPFPVDLCQFCLSGMPTGCPAGGFMPGKVVSGCIPWQDFSLTCCIDNTNTLVCGDQVPMSM